MGTLLDNNGGYSYSMERIRRQNRTRERQVNNKYELWGTLGQFKDWGYDGTIMGDTVTAWREEEDKTR